MTALFRFSDAFVVRFRETVFIIGLILVGSSTTLRTFWDYPHMTLNDIGCILLLQSIALFPFHRQCNGRNWLSLLSLGLMLILSIILLFIGTGRFLILALIFIVLNIIMIKREIK